MTFHFLGDPRIYNDRGDRCSNLSQKTMELLAYLWLHRNRSHARTQLAGRFWPEIDESKARRNLRHALHELRQCLEPTEADQSTFFVVDRGSIRFRSDAPARVDVAGFEEKLEAGEAVRGPDRIRSLKGAVELYRGDFLEGCYADWCLIWRERFRASYRNALARLTQELAERRQYEAARRYARRRLHANPLQEDGHRALMVLHYASGNRAGAIEQYRNCERVLVDELGIEPSAKTQLLYRQIKAEAADTTELFATLGWAPPTAPSNVPEALTQFVGRQGELKALIEALQSERLLTLTGVGGCGKTRLALEAARRCLGTDQFPDGVWFVDLAHVVKVDEITQAVGDAIGVAETAAESTREAVLAHLATQRTLLVLDNCEHSLGACAQLVETILGNCPNVTVLATSRETLRLPEEMRWDVPPLSVPAPKSVNSLAELEESEAGRLFLERARSHCSDEVLAQADPMTAAQVCRRLDGLPLPLELAAAQLETLSLTRIDRELEQRYRLPEPDGHSGPARHRTLETLLDWSYDWMCEAEQALFRRLAVFACPFTLADARAVCADDDLTPADVTTCLSRLVAQSLVDFADRNLDQPRYRLLETVRAYGHRKLETCGEKGVWHRRHLHYALHLASQAEPELSGPHQEDWLATLNDRHPDIRVALRRALEEGEHKKMGAELATRLWRFWKIRGEWKAGRAWLNQAIPRCHRAVKAQALQGAGDLAWMLGDHEAARAQLEASLDLYRAEQRYEATAHVLLDLGIVTFLQGETERARGHLQESLWLYRRLASTWGIALARLNLGILAHTQGELERAKSHYEASLSHFHRISEKRGIAHVLVNRGKLALDQQDIAQAETDIKAASRRFEQLGDQAGLIRALLYEGKLAYRQGQYEQAAARFQAAQALGASLNTTPDALLAPAQRAEFQTLMNAARGRSHAGRHRTYQGQN